MYNEILKIGPVTIYGYGLMIGIGLLAAFFMADKRAKAKGLDPDHIFNMGFISAILGFVGAKLLFLLLDLPVIIQSGNFWAYLTGNGFIVYGGIISGVLTAVVYSRIKKVAFLKYFDLAAPSISVAQAFGRLGCFLAGCCYGRETDLPIGITFRHSNYAPNNVSLIPTQIISSLGNFGITLILILYARKERPAGKVGGLYIILYAVGRFAVEFLRNDYRGSIGPLSTSQFIAVLMLIPGLLLFLMPAFKKDEKKDVKEDVETDID